MTKDNETLSPEGQSKRANLKKIAKGAVYAVPVITAFHVGDMMTNEANAYNGSPTGGNGGGSPTGGNGGSGGHGGGHNPWAGLPRWLIRLIRRILGGGGWN